MTDHDHGEEGAEGHAAGGEVEGGVVSVDLNKLMAAMDEAKKQPLCPTCGKPLRRTCDGKGWLDAIEGADGSYITSRPCPNENPFAVD